MRWVRETLVALALALAIGMGGGQAQARSGGDEIGQTRNVVEGWVGDVRSQWNAEHSLIYSRAAIQVVGAWEEIEREAVSDGTGETTRIVSEAAHWTSPGRSSLAAKGTIVVVFEGGQVDGEALYVSNGVALAVGQRVRLRLAPQPTGEYRIMGGADGVTILDGKQETTRPAQALPSTARRWERDRLPVPYFVSANAPDVAGAADAVRAAFATWQAVDCSYMAYAYQGVTERTGGGRDGYNTVSWGQADGSLAKIRWWVDASGSLTEFDIIFAEDRRWGVDGAADRFDIQNVATHEAGHTLVLDDLYDPQATERVMYGYIRKGETHKRVLHRDDIASICALYPRGGLSPTAYLPIVGR